MLNTPKTDCLLTVVTKLKACIPGCVNPENTWLQAILISGASKTYITCKIDPQYINCLKGPSHQQSTQPCDYFKEAYLSRPAHPQWHGS